MRTSFNIPDEVVEEFDRVWQDEGLENRSRAVREAMLEFIEAHSRLEDTIGEIVALVGFDYRHHDVIQELHGVQHEYQDVILNTSHTHQASGVSSRCFVAVLPNGYANSRIDSVISTGCAG